MSNDWPVFIISLPEALERQAMMRAQLNEVGVENFIFIQAIKGSEITAKERALLYDDAQAKVNNGRSMTSGELGCALSHLVCYRMIVSSDVDWAVILEDDSVLPKNFTDIVNKLINHQEKINSDIVLLGRLRKFIKKPVLKISDQYSVVIPVRAWNANAYLINKNASSRILRINSPVSYSADDWMSFISKSEIDIRGLDGFLCDQNNRELKSLLEVDRAVARKKSGASPAYFIRKAFRRLKEFKISFCRELGHH